MLSEIIRVLISVLMILSPTLPHSIGLPAIPKGQKVDIFESMYYKDNAIGYGDAVVSGIHYTATVQSIRVTV